MVNEIQHQKISPTLSTLCVFVCLLRIYLTNIIGILKKSIIKRCVSSIGFFGKILSSGVEVVAQDVQGM